MKLRINVAADFTPVPIGRSRAESNTSGEVFRVDILCPKIREALKERETLEVDFTGMHGLSGSFLEEAFAGLVREEGLTAKEVLQTIEFKPADSHFDLYIELVKEYIKKAKQKTSPA